MLYKNFSIFLFLFASPFIIANPFYKTMSKDAEKTYNKLKNIFDYDCVGPSEGDFKWVTHVQCEE